MKTLLITGASGFLGWNVCRKARHSYRVFGTYFSKPKPEVADVCFVRCDMRNDTSVNDLFKYVHPDAVIHTAAASQPNYCQTHKAETDKINVHASASIASLCNEYQVPCIFTSTDLVFDGTSAPYSEDDPVSPISYYGEQKVRAEKEMCSRHDMMTICRMPLMFGDTPPNATSFIQPWIQAIEDGKTLSLFVDEFRTPVSGSTAASGILHSLENVRGIIHLGGKDRISRYDFGALLAGISGRKNVPIKASRRSEVLMAAPRPEDVSLCSEKAFSSGYAPASLKEQLQELKCIRKSVPRTSLDE